MGGAVFLFDQRRDEYNIWDTCNNSPSKYDRDFSKDINPELYAATRGKSFEESRKKIAELNNDIYNSPILPLFVLENINKAWRSIEGEYIKRMENLTGKSFYPTEIKAYLTTISKCPYDIKEGSFMFNAFSGVFNVLRTAGHEIFHLQFHKYFFDDISKELGKEDSHNLKEALTVLLNLEFKDLWVVEDKGYESHKALREFIKKEWLKEKDFNKLLKKCIIYIKTERGKQK